LVSQSWLLVIQVRDSIKNKNEMIKISLAEADTITVKEFVKDDCTNKLIELEKLSHDTAMRINALVISFRGLCDKAKERRAMNDNGNQDN
jgi:hypothetical protein